MVSKKPRTGSRIMTKGTEAQAQLFTAAELALPTSTALPPERVQKAVALLGELLLQHVDLRRRAPTDGGDQDG